MALQTIGLGGVFTFDNTQAIPSMGRARDELGRFVAGANQVTPAMSQMSNSVTTAVAQIKAQTAALGPAIRGAVDSIRNAAIGMLPLTATVGIGLKTASDFERQMSIVGAVSGATAVEFDSLQKKAQEMGVVSVFSATEAGQAMEAMAKAGANTKEILAGLGGVMSAAASDSIPLGTAADIVSQVVKGMGLQFADASHVADVLAYSAAATNTDIIGMGESFVYGAGQARMMGISLEETAAVMGKLADAGQRGSLGGTTFSNMLEKLSKPSREGAGLMQQWGIKLTDATGKFRKITDIVAEFQSHIEKTPNMALRARYATEIFGIRGARAYTALALAGKTATDELEQALLNSSEGLGYATETANKKLDNFAGAMKLFKSSMESLGINIFGPMLVPFADTVKKITGGLNNVLMSLQGVQDIQKNQTLETMKSAEALGRYGTEQALSLGMAKNQELVVKKYMNTVGQMTMLNRDLTSEERGRYDFAKKRLNEIMGKEKLKGSIAADSALQAIYAQMQVDAAQMRGNDLMRVRLFQQEKLAQIEKDYGHTAVVVAQGLQDAVNAITDAWRHVVVMVTKAGDTLRTKIGDDRLRSLVKIATIFMLMAAAAAPLILAFLAFSWTIGNVIKSIMAMKTLLLTAFAAIKGVLAAVAGAALPLLLVIGAIALAFSLFRNEGESFGETMARAWDLVKESALALYQNVLLPIYNWLKSTLIPAFKQIGATLAFTWGGVVDEARIGMSYLGIVMSDAYANSILPFAQGIQDAFVPVWETLKETWAGVWAVIGDTFGETWTMIKSTLSEIAAQFMGTAEGAEINWRELGQTIMSIVGALAVTVVEVVGFMVNTIMEVTQLLLPVMKIPFIALINFLKLFVSGFQDIMNGSFMDGLYKIGIAIFDALTTPIRMALRAIMAMAEKVPGAEKLMGSEFMKSAKQFAEGGLTSFTFPVQQAVIGTATQAAAGYDFSKPEVADVMDFGGVALAGDLKRTIANLTDLKASQQRRDQEKTEVKVELTDKRQMNINTNVNVDGEKVAGAVSRHKQEVSDRAGFKSMPWARRMSAEQGATITRGGGGVS
jgi:TP901 family phage tail tape measure protein